MTAWIAGPVSMERVAHRPRAGGTPTHTDAASVVGQTSTKSKGEHRMKPPSSRF